MLIVEVLLSNLQTTKHKEPYYHPKLLESHFFFVKEQSWLSSLDLLCITLFKMTPNS